MRALLLALAAAQAPGAGAEPAEDPGSRALYLRYCAACHGADGRGDGPAALEMTPPPADLTRSTLSREALVRAIENGGAVSGHGSSEMPVWGAVFFEAATGGEQAQTSARIKIDALAQEVMRLRAAAGATP